MPPEQAAPPPALDRRGALALLAALLVVVLVCAALALVARGPSEAAGRALVERLGAPGVLLGVTLAETSPVPLAGEPVLYLGLRGGMSLGLIAALGCAGNLLAAALSYAGGAVLRRLGLVERALGARLAPAEDAVRRRGAWALVLASITPLPFGTLAWVAGALRMPPGAYALACLVRVPKVIVYLAAMEAGWALGG